MEQLNKHLQTVSLLIKVGIAAVMISASIQLVLLSTLAYQRVQIAHNVKQILQGLGDENGWRESVTKKLDKCLQENAFRSEGGLVYGTYMQNDGVK